MGQAQSTTAWHAATRTAEAAAKGGQEGDDDGDDKEDDPPREEARVVTGSTSADYGALVCGGEIQNRKMQCHLTFFHIPPFLLLSSYLIVILALAAIYLVPLVGERRLDVLSKLFDVVREISVVRRWGLRTIIVVHVPRKGIFLGWVNLPHSQ